MRISDWSSDVCSSDLDPDQGLAAFRTVEAEEFAGERKLVAFFEDAHGLLDDLDVEGLADRYFDLLQKFTAKYSLRYDLRSPCVLCPTLPGVFSGLMRDLKESVFGVKDRMSTRLNS